LTQPAVSNALTRLRETLQDPLFVRESRAMAPTPFARRLIEPVRQSLRHLQLALNELDRFDPATAQRQFNLGTPDVLESTLLPPLMKLVSQRAPHLGVVSNNYSRRDLERLLATGALDVAFDLVVQVSEQIRHTRFVADRMVVVARRGHPEVNDNLDLKTYMRQEHIVVSSGRSGRGVEDIEMERHALRRHVRLRCQSEVAACRVVSQTNLILTMPERYVRVTNTLFNNQIVPFPAPTTTLDVHLYWHANVETDPANAWLRQLLLESV
jgi:DNA-binding transcriptional LysR family regulator